MRFTYWLTLILAFFTSCERAPSPESPIQRSDPARAATPLVHLPADTTCLFDSTAFYPDAPELLNEFLRRDSNGDFLRSETWYGTAWMCPGHVPGWDAATLISSYEVRAAEVGDSLASFEIHYDVIGRLAQDAEGIYLLDQPALQVDTFVLLKTRHGWRLSSPVQHQHVKPQGALVLQRLKPESRTRISELVR